MGQLGKKKSGMEEPKPNELDRHRVEKLLIDLHLDQIADADRKEIEAMLDSDPELGRLSDAVGRSLRPLDYWTVPAMPENLIEKTLSRIQRGAAPSEAIPPDPADRSPTHPFGRLRFPVKELLAVVASIALLAGIFVPSLSELRDRSKKSRCATNLGSIFQGSKLYQASFAGALPYAGAQGETTWLPAAGRSDRPYASNSRHIFLLAKYNFGPSPERFVCPSAPNGAPMPVAELATQRDFARMKNISYDSLNLAGGKPNLRPTTSLAYAGDRNPLFRSGRFDASVDPNQANSRAHRSSGQSVLALDGSVQWITSPFFGKTRDNIWLAGNIRRYDGTERPTDPRDAQLVPGYPASDPSVQRMLAR